MIRTRRLVAVTITLLVVIILGSSSIAATGPELTPEEGGDIDLGVTTEGQLKYGSLSITNTGDSELSINHYMSTCSCLKVIKAPEGALQPGESADFEFVFDTEGLAGKVAKKDLLIFSNASDNPNRITVSTKVRKPASYQINAEKVFEGFTLIVDIRPPESFAGGHILGAINVPAGDFENWARSLPPEITVYVYCKEGKVSDELAKRLNPKFQFDLRSLVGGYLQWKREHESYVVEGK